MRNKGKTFESLNKRFPGFVIVVAFLCSALIVLGLSGIAYLVTYDGKTAESKLHTYTSTAPFDKEIEVRDDMLTDITSVLAFGFIYDADSLVEPKPGRAINKVYNSGYYTPFNYIFSIDYHKAGGELVSVHTHLDNLRLAPKEDDPALFRVYLIDEATNEWYVEMNITIEDLSRAMSAEYFHEMDDVQREFVLQILSETQLTL